MAIVDNSCLSSLTYIGHLDLLSHFFSDLMIVVGVREEFVEKWSEVDIQQYVKVITPEKSREEIITDHPAMENFGKGDIGSFFLALTTKDLLITDDKKLRTQARNAGIDVVGTLRLLKDGFSTGYFSSKQAYFIALDKLAEDLYISEVLMDWAKQVD